MRIRRTLLNLSLLLVATIVAIGVAELLVRVMAPQQLIHQRPDLYRPLDSLGWAHQPNVDTHVNTGDRTVSVHTDSSGFRIGVAGRPPGRFRILLLGDSFVAAMQVEHEQSIAGLIERCFELRTGQTAAVWNTGVSGWDPPQYYFQERRLIGVVPFDLVLVSVYLGNDVVQRRVTYLPPRQPDPRRTFRVPRRFTHAEAVDALLAPINDRLEARSHLFVFLKNRFQSILMRLGLSAVEVPMELRRDRAGSERWGLTGAFLGEIDSLASAHHIPVVFALVPSPEQVDPAVLEFRTRALGIDSASLDIDQPDRLIGAELQHRGLTFVSLLQPLRDSRARGRSLFGRVDPHLSADGHRVFWNAVAPVLIQRLNLPDQADGGGPSCAAP